MGFVSLPSTLELLLPLPPIEIISKTGTLVLTGGGLKSFNFSGIKDRFKPTKRHGSHPSVDGPKPNSRQSGSTKAIQSSSGSATPFDSSAEGSTSEASTTIIRVSEYSQSSETRPISYSTTSLSSKGRRFGSIDSTSSRGHSDHSESSTPRNKLMSFIHRAGSPRSSPTAVRVLTCLF